MRGEGGGLSARVTGGRGATQAETARHVPDRPRLQQPLEARLLPWIDHHGAVVATQLCLVKELQRVRVQEEEMAQQDACRCRCRRQQIDGATRVTPL